MINKREPFQERKSMMLQLLNPGLKPSVLTRLDDTMFQPQEPDVDREKLYQGLIDSEDERYLSSPHYLSIDRVVFCIWIMKISRWAFYMILKLVRTIKV